MGEGACAAAFLTTNRPEVTHWFGQIQRWAHGKNFFTQAALNKFGSVADAWLVAHALATGRTVVTRESWDLKQRNEIKVPIVCKQFGVPHVRTFEMLRDLNAKIG